MEFQCYQDKRKGWRWRLVAANGLTIADSAEAYSRKSGVERAVDSIRDFGIGMHNARIKFLEYDIEFQSAAKPEQSIGKVIQRTATAVGKAGKAYRRANRG